jgi:hypothetical protein
MIFVKQKQMVTLKPYDGWIKSLRYDTVLDNWEIHFRILYVRINVLY